MGTLRVEEKPKIQEATDKKLFAYSAEEVFLKTEALPG